jgi:hypothetical protein
MPIEIGQSASWPGVLAVESCVGTISHGIAPAVFVLTTYPQTAAPAEFGNLVITDGFRSVVLRDCKADVARGRYGPDGQTYILTILDRRWKWQGGEISGRYNQVDQRGKLVPWSIRSPAELAKLCLEKMGERNYSINLPQGLPASAGQQVERLLRPGENFPQSLANPPVVWDRTNPAAALARMCEEYGCRVIYQPNLDRTLIAPLGEGQSLPDGPCEMIAPSLDSPETPVAVAVAGAPIKWQWRFILEPVGREWDGTYLPINQLSYAPDAESQVQISKAAFTGTGSPTLTIRVILNPEQPNEIVASFRESAPSGTVAQKVARLATRINANPDVAKILVATSDATSVTLKGRKVGEAFWVEVQSDDITPPDKWAGEAIQLAGPPGKKSWRSCMPPNFGNVKETDRLSYTESVKLARESVFRCFRIRYGDPGTGKGPVILPGRDKPVIRRQQFLLQQTKVEQVVPAPRKFGGRDRDTAPNGDPRNDPLAREVFGGILPDFYNGYSRDQEATVTGSVSRQLGSVFWDPNGDLNTDQSDRVYVSFTIDPIEQMVVFSDYVYRYWPVAGKSLRIQEPYLVLETGTYLTDDTTNELVRFDQVMPLGGRGPVEWAIREDIAVGVIPTFDSKNRVTKFDLDGEEDAKKRAKFYLDGMARKYRLEGGDSRQYIGIYPIDPDGRIQQVTWSVGQGGASTQASENSEHSDVIPTYPSRRRAENLPPDRAAAQANMLERRFLENRIPKPPGAS